MSREVELGSKVGLLSLRVVPQQQCNGHCLCDSAQARQLKQQLNSAQVAGQWRGDAALTLPLFWRRSTVSPVFLGRRYPRSSLHSFEATDSVIIDISMLQRPSRRPLSRACESRGGRPGFPVPNKPSVSVDVKQHFNNNNLST